MADWAVDCPPSTFQLDSSTQDPALQRKAQHLSAVSVGGELEGGESLLFPSIAGSSTCVRKKFGQWQFNVLTSFQGYLARLPLQHQQLMVLQHFSRSTREMQDNNDEMQELLLETTSLQREALETLQHTTDHIVTLIDDQMIPFIDNLPDVSGLDHFVAQLQGYVDNAENTVAIVKRTFTMILPATALMLTLINWISYIPILYSMMPSVAICLVHRAGLLPFQHAFIGLWLVFWVLRALYPSTSDQMPEEEILYRNIAQILAHNRKRDKF